MRKKKSEAVEIVESAEAELYAKVRGYIAKARAKVYAVANKEMVLAYWNVGREIVEKQGGEARAKYGDGLIKGLSMKLTAEFGPGYTVANLRNMRQFFLAFEKRYTLCSELGWSHFRLLMRVEKKDARDFYFRECAQSKWSVRVLKRQIDTHFYDRLVANHVDLRTAGKLVKKDRGDAKDVVRSPAILEFAGLDATRAYAESDLQAALVKHLGKFMMELGRGFCLEREQRPIPIGGKTFHCDLVFYNYIARCFVLIDLKVGEVTPEDIGQISAIESEDLVMRKKAVPDKTIPEVAAEAARKSMRHLTGKNGRLNASGRKMARLLEEIMPAERDGAAGGCILI